MALTHAREAVSAAVVSTFTIAAIFPSSFMMNFTLTVLPPAGMAPLLSQLLADYAATGLPPAYLPAPTSVADQDLA